MIPNKEDWEEAWKKLDEAYAFRHFIGKSIQEAENMIHEHTMVCEDFMWMPEKPFKFYFLAYKKYLNSNRSKLNFYASTSFISLIELFIKIDKLDWINDKWESIEYIFKKLIEREESFPDFMGGGDFEKRIKKLKVT